MQGKLRGFLQGKVFDFARDFFIFERLFKIFEWDFEKFEW